MAMGSMAQTHPRDSRLAPEGCACPGRCHGSNATRSETHVQFRCRMLSELWLAACVMFVGHVPVSNSMLPL